MTTVIRSFDDEGSADHAVRDISAINIDSDRVYRINNEGRAVGWLDVMAGRDDERSDDEQGRLAIGGQQVNPLPVGAAAPLSGAGTGNLGAGATPTGGTTGAWGLLALNQIDADYYAKHAGAGHIILAVDAPDDQADRVASILDRNGGQDMRR